MQARLPTCTLGRSQQKRGWAEGRVLVAREKQSPLHPAPLELYAQGRGRLITVVHTRETLGINWNDRGSDWVRNSSLNYPVIFYFPYGLASHV